MKILVTKQECSKYLHISFYRKEEDFTKYIQEAQFFDLKPLCTEPFFEDLTEETPERDYNTLLNGGNYEYKGKKYHFQGLKAVIAYFAYARYILLGHQTDTPFGVKEKRNQDSEALPQAERRDTRLLYVQNANTLWVDCKNYIERNLHLFPEWKNSDCNSEKTTKNANFRMQLI